MNKRILVLDTNVLLTEPQALYRFPNSLVVIPQTVLSELDKIKIRADKTLQYNGRLVSRYLFSISAAGNLSEGVELENGSTIKVSSIDDKTNLPPNFKTKLSDDQILALAYQLKEQNKGSEVVIITNDLNMLIKAQSLGLKIEYHNAGSNAASKVKRFISNQLATIRKNPIIALFSALTLSGIIAIIFVLANIGSPPAKGPPELIAQQQMFQAQETQYLDLLDKNPSDQKALFGLAELYVKMGHYYQDSQYYSKSIDLLSNFPKSSGRNFRIEAMMARLRFYLGMNDIAYADLDKIIRSKSDSALAALQEQAHQATGYKDYRISIIFLQKALIIKPRDLAMRLDLAQAFYDNDQADQTIKELHKALEIDSKNGIIYYNLGYVYWQKRADASTAISYFQKYIELEPKGQYIKLAKKNIEQIKKDL